MFELFVSYRTGNSFGSEEIKKEELGIIFATKELATQGLADLKEHYEYVKTYDKCAHESSWSSKKYPEDKTKEQVAAEVRDKIWAYFENTYSQSWQFSMSFETGLKSGRTFISLPYVGYFETLNKAWVEEVNNPLQVTFD